MVLAAQWQAMYVIIRLHILPTISQQGPWMSANAHTAGSHGDLATPARELVLALLTRLSNLGYSLHTSLLSSPGSDKDSLIFRKTPRTVGAGRQFFAVCYYKSDKIKVIDCPDEGIKEALNTAIKVRTHPQYQPDTWVCSIQSRG